MRLLTQLPDIEFAKAQGWISFPAKPAKDSYDEARSAQKRECMRRLRAWQKIHGSDSKPPRKQYKVRRKSKLKNDYSGTVKD